MWSFRWDPCFKHGDMFLHLEFQTHLFGFTTKTNLYSDIFLRKWKQPCSAVTLNEWLHELSLFFESKNEVLKGWVYMHKTGTAISTHCSHTKLAFVGYRFLGHLMKYCSVHRSLISGSCHITKQILFLVVWWLMLFPTSYIWHSLVEPTREITPSN